MKWLSKVDSSKRKVLERSQRVSLYFSWNFLVNVSVLTPIWIYGCLEEIFKVKNDLNSPFVDKILYIVTSYYFDQNPWFSMDLYIYIYMLQSVSVCVCNLEIWTIILLHIFITISWILTILNWWLTNHENYSLRFKIKVTFGHKLHYEIKVPFGEISLKLRMLSETM